MKLHIAKGWQTYYPSIPNYEDPAIYIWAEGEDDD